MNMRVISIGAMGANDLWNERKPVRTGHATTTLIETHATDNKAEVVRILVDPGLPEAALTARLSERANLKPEDITHVFLTSFHPECRRAINAFDRATWLISDRERETVGVPLAEGLKRLAMNFDNPDEDVEAVLRADIGVLQQCQPAPDVIAQNVSLFPLPGMSPGLCGLLLEGRETTLICGDAIPTALHVERGKIPASAADPELAKESLQEAIEIADILVPGRDNVMANPTRRPF